MSVWRGGIGSASKGGVAGDDGGDSYARAREGARFAQHDDAGATGDVALHQIL